MIDLVAAQQPVVGKHRRNRDDQAERGHDQRLTDRAGDGVDRRLTGRADLDQRAVDADDGAEQADERRGRTDGGEEGEAARRACEVIAPWLRASELCIQSCWSIGSVSLSCCSWASRPSSTIWR